MRMISRREALDLLADHGWGPKTCVVSHARDDGKASVGDGHCESFDSYLGKHDQYAVIDVKNWLGY